MDTTGTLCTKETFGSGGSGGGNTTTAYQLLGTGTFPTITGVGANVTGPALTTVVGGLYNVSLVGTPGAAVTVTESNGIGSLASTVVYTSATNTAQYCMGAGDTIQASTGSGASGVALRMTGAGSCPGATTIVYDPSTGNPVPYPNPAPTAHPADAVYTFSTNSTGVTTVSPVAGPVNLSAFHSAACHLNTPTDATVSYEVETSPDLSSAGTYFFEAGSQVTGAVSANYAAQIYDNNEYLFAFNAQWMQVNVITNPNSDAVQITCNLSQDTFGVLQPTLTVGLSSEAGALVNPTQIGYESRTSSKTSVSNGRQVRGIATPDGRGISLPYSIPEAGWHYAPPAGGIVNSTAGVTAVAAAGSGVHNYVTDITLSWDLLTNATEFVINDGSAGTVLWRFKIPAGAAGHTDHVFTVPLRGSTATLVQIQTLTASGAGGVEANLSGYQAND